MRRDSSRGLRGRAVFGSALLLSPLLASGCLTVGRGFPTRPVASIQVGRTTSEEIERTFGEPWRTGLEDGERTWTYGHYRYSLFGASETRDLVVRFDDRGVVSSYSFNSTMPGDLP